MKEGVRPTWVELLRRLAPLLPADLFDRLRVSPYPATLSTDEEEVFGKDLLQTIHILSSLYHTLTNFLPRYLLDLAPTPGQPPYADFYALFAHACLRPPPLTSLDHPGERGEQVTQQTTD